MGKSLLDALDATDNTRGFTCPRTGLALEVRILPGPDIRAAHASAMTAWGDRKLVTRFDEEDLASIMLEHMLAVAVFHEGEPIGLETAGKLDDRTKSRYAAEYATKEDEFDPPLEDWTSEQVTEFIDGLKKKESDPGCVARLRTFDAPTLVGLLLYTASRLSRCETSSSPPSGSGNESEAEMPPAEEAPLQP
jgi:hypothetical protein